MKEETVTLGHSLPNRRDTNAVTDKTDLDSAWLNAVRRKLVDWYVEAHRDLPWRRNRDAYRILVSETMLVQTTVAAVVPYFERFLAKFPTLEALAQADEAEVVKAWEGLGYYRRARQLHAAAKTVVREHGGVIPDDPVAVRALPGVGPYITGAILSFAFDRPAPIVEANTQRVLARWLALTGDLKASATRSRLWEAAGRLVPTVGAGAFNQAFMELGALVCTPKSPLCLVCPVTAECRARTLGMQNVLPIAVPKPPPLRSAEAAALVIRGGRILIVRRGPRKLWEGFWEFPTIHISGADPAGRSFQDGLLSLTEGVQRLTGATVKVGDQVRTIQYSVTKHRVRIDAHEAAGLTESLTPGPGLDAAIWEVPERLGDYSFSSAGRKLISWAVQHLPRGDPE